MNNQTTEPNKIQTLRRRLKKIGIILSLHGNYPQIYLTHIGPYRVSEKRGSEHGWVIGYQPNGKGRQMEIVGVSDLFKLIRYYHCEHYEEVASGLKW